MQLSVSAGGTWPRQAPQTPLVQVRVPSRQVPTLRNEAWYSQHGSVRLWTQLQKGGSSMRPSQLLSRPSQISVWGLGAVQFSHRPLTQTSSPVPQAVVQDCLAPSWQSQLLSTTPSQSLSSPSQRSAVGLTWP